MSSRFSTAMVCAIAVLCAMAPLALAQTSGIGSSGPSDAGPPGSGIGPGPPGSEMGPGTPGSPPDQSGTGITGGTGSGSTGVGPETPGSPTNRPDMGINRPG